MPGDEANERGRMLLARLCLLDSVVLCGQASSHCVNFSGRDLAAAWRRTTAGSSEEEARRRMAGLVVLKDGTSPVPGFEVSRVNMTSFSCFLDPFEFGSGGKDSMRGACPIHLRDLEVARVPCPTVI